MGKRVLALVLMVVMLGSLIVTQGQATQNGRSTVSLGDVTIGVILQTPGDVPILTPIFQLAEQDINSKLSVSGATAHFTFDIRYMTDPGALQEHDYWLNYFHKQGIDLVIGGYSSFQAEYSLGTIAKNHQLLFSPSSTGPNLVIPNDGLFRMCPNDELIKKPLNDMMVSLGVRHVIILCSNDWVETYFLPYYLSVNTIPQDTIIFKGGDEDAVLSSAASLVISNQKTAVLVMSGWTVAELYNKALNYPPLAKLNWFGIDPDDLVIQQNAPIASAKLHLYSPLLTAPPEAMTKFNSLNSRMLALAGRTISIWDGYNYDVAWVIAKSVLTAKSKVASDVIGVLPRVSGNYLGVTGYCKLDVNGDRANPYFEIIGYYLKPHSQVQSYCKSYGYCEPSHNRVVWYNQNAQGNQNVL